MSAATRRNTAGRKRPMATRRAPRRGPALRLPPRAILARRLLACAGLLCVLVLVGGAIAAGLRRESGARQAAVAPPHPAQPTSIALSTPRAAAPALARPVVAVNAGADEGALPVVAPPSVPAAAIDAALSREGSPLAGQGAYIVAAGRRSGIDPVFLLAFVSHFDLRDPLPAAAHNVGHIRATGREAALEGYRVYPNWQDGIAAWYALIRDRYVAQWGLRTLDAIVPVYAPSSQAGVEAELADLRAMVAAWRADSR